MTCSSTRREAGYSYVEVLVATALVVLALIPALESLSTGLLGTRAHIASATEDLSLASRLEDLLAQPFDVLDAEALAVGSSTVPTVFSDAPGTSPRLLVFVARYDGDDADGDGDGFTGTDEGLLWLSVQVENTHRALSTLTAR